MQLKGAGRGFVLMAAVTVGVFLLIRSFTNTLVGVAAAALFVGGWWLLNRRAGTSGLVEANLRAYFKARDLGSSHDEALLQMVRSRYPEDPTRAEAVYERAASLSPVNPGPSAPLSADEATELKTLVYAVFVAEHGPPPSEKWHEKILGYIRDGYEELAEAAAQSA